MSPDGPVEVCVIISPDNGSETLCSWLHSLMWPPCPAGNGTSSFPTSPSTQAEPALSPGGHSPSPQSPKQQARASTPEITHISPATFPTHPCHVQWESLCQPAVRFDHHYYDIKHISHMRASSTRTHPTACQTWESGMFRLRSTKRNPKERNAPPALSFSAKSREGSRREQYTKRSGSLPGMSNGLYGSGVCVCVCLCVSTCVATSGCMCVSWCVSSRHKALQWMEEVSVLDPSLKPALLSGWAKRSHFRDPLQKLLCQTRLRAKLLISLQTLGVGRNFRKLVKFPYFITKVRCRKDTFPRTHSC